mgnify:CR=1 FL=1
MLPHIFNGAERFKPFNIDLKLGTVETDMGHFRQLEMEQFRYQHCLINRDARWIDNHTSLLLRSGLECLIFIFLKAIDNQVFLKVNNIQFL